MYRQLCSLKVEKSSSFCYVGRVNTKSGFGVPVPRLQYLGGSLVFQKEIRVGGCLSHCGGGSDAAERSTCINA
jgi:hypothetical protein